MDVLLLVLAGGTGVGIGMLVLYLTAVLPLVKTLEAMRYRGFEPERELPAEPDVPKVSPLWETIRE